eukprot:scaffold515679_cov32-Prasinocladus_malaysianus.AAC.1
MYRYNAKGIRRLHPPSRRRSKKTFTLRMDVRLQALSLCACESEGMEEGFPYGTYRYADANEQPLGSNFILVALKRADSASYNPVTKNALNRLC